MPAANKLPQLFAASLPANQLGPAPDYRRDDWPIAVDPSLIIPDDGFAEKQYRALQIVGMITTDFAQKNVLDCGCGEGYVSHEMAATAANVVGYDIKSDNTWDGTRWGGSVPENLIFTTEKSVVSDNAPFDFILLYDVIDHLRQEDPEKFLEWLASVLKADGKILVRTHPWTSKTGGHCYRQANKAWIHLALTPDELAKAELTPEEPNLKVVRPMAAYELWFRGAGLSVADKHVKAETIDGSFDDNIIQRIIKTTWAGAIDATTAKKIMANHFVDYVLEKHG